MANITGVSTQFKMDSMTAILPGGISTLKAALYLATASITEATTAYTATGEVSSSGTNYTAGGVGVTSTNAPVLSGTKACWTPSASIIYAAVSLTTSFDAVMIYDAARANKAIGVWNFGSQTVNSGTLTLTMPANDSANALLRA